MPSCSSWAVVSGLRLFRPRPSDADIRLADGDLIQTRSIAGAFEGGLRRGQIGAAHLDFGLQRAAIDGHKQLAGIDVIAIADEDFLDHAGRGNSELHSGWGRGDAGWRLREGEGWQQRGQGDDARRKPRDSSNQHRGGLYCP